MKDYETRKLFTDMQQNPESYSDDQIENIITELDKPVDVEAAWKDFSRKNITEDATRATAGQPARLRFVYGWKAIAVVVLIALGIWGMAVFFDKEETPQLVENTGNQEGGNLHEYTSSSHLSSGSPSLDKPQKDTVIAERKLVAQVTAAQENGSAARSFMADEPVLTDHKIRIRGNGTISPDREPVVIVNGKRVQGVDVLSLLKTDDIENISIWKDEDSKSPFKARFGNQAAYGVIEITLKTGRELAYADILNPALNGEDIFSVGGKMPDFPGGRVALKAYLDKHLKYPSEVRDSAVVGQVIIGFVVGEDGTLQDFKVAHRFLKNADKTDCTDSVIGAAFAEEALRVCRMMPHWIPGEIHTDNGYRNVCVKYFLPFRFGERKREGLRIR